MTPPEGQTIPVCQTFKSQDDIPLASLLTHVCAESDKRFVYWKDIEETFESVFYLQDVSDERLLFMIDENAELHIPLRIEHDPDDDYTVVYINSHRPHSDIYREQGNALIPTPITLFEPLERLFTTTTYLFDRLKLTPNAARATFLQLVANARYYHALLVKEIQSLDDFGFRSQFPRIDRTLVLKRVQKLDEQVPEWDYRNICFNMFYGDHGKWDYATSKLFVVLPSDLDSWVDDNPSTHHFRLYFLCDNNMDVLAKRGMPQHVHLSNHPGYILKQPQEFFTKYGDYVLRLLQLVRLGYSDNAYDIPAIDTFNILWKYKTHPGSNLSRDTIRPLVEKAIAHIEKILPPKWTMEPGLTRSQSAAIKDFLVVQRSDNAEGNLHHHIDSQQCVSWRCQKHKEQYFAQKPLEALRVHVSRRRGHIDLQQARLRVELQSYTESAEFQKLLTNIRLPFNLSIKLNWNTTRSYVEKLCQDVSQLKAATLDIEGINLNIYPQGYVHYTHNIFADKVLPETGLQLITVLNYPRPQEQCIHIGNFSLQSKISPSRSSHSWVELRSDLDRFGRLLSKAQVASECEAAATELKFVKKKHGLSDTNLITIHGEKWAAVFDLREFAVIEAYSHDAECPQAIRSSGSLRKFTVDLSDLEFDKQFFQVVDANPGLQYLNVAYYGRRVFSYIEHLIKSWRESSSSYCLTLIDRLEGTQGRIVAQMMAQRPDSGTFEVDSTTSSTWNAKKAASPPGIQFLKWDEDQASILADHHAMFLDVVTLQHPSALRLLTVDTSRLSGDGLDSIRNVLHRSRLEHLNLVCKPVDSTLSQSISEVLRAIPWGTLKSLVLSGNDTNGCMELCPMPEEPRLLSLQIQGTGPAPQELAHSSALFIHHLASESSLEKMVIKGVQMKDPSDWRVIVDAPDPAHLKKIELCTNGMSQLRSNADVAALYDSKFMTSAGTKARTPVLKTQSLQDVFAQSPNRTSQRDRDTVSQISISTSEMSDEAETLAPCYLSEMTNSVKTQAPSSSPKIASDVERQTLHSSSEMAGCAETQASIATSETSDETQIPMTTSEMSDDTGTQTSVAMSEMSDDAETQASIVTSETSDDAETLVPCSSSEMSSNTKTQASSSSSETSDNAETRAPSVALQIAQGIVSQTPVTPAKKASDFETQMPGARSKISSKTVIQTVVGTSAISGGNVTRMAARASVISGDTETQTLVATSKIPDNSGTQMLCYMRPTPNTVGIPNNHASSQNMVETRKKSLWRRMCCWC
ncbi:hypothetical protein BG000_007097 [Podila horticola]|nr:hypothetical protein BG000_007097 [Podila horticola]